MSLFLPDLTVETRRAVQNFWSTRTQASSAQQERGISDSGQRGAVTAGKNMDGFLMLLREIVIGNGLPGASIYSSKEEAKPSRHVTIPGYYRPTKNWDIIVVHQGALVAAIELKSQVGSFGNNFNNRCEEAIGTATDLLTAFREGAFGDHPRPFLGYLMLVEDSQKSRQTVSIQSEHFAAFPEFKDTSYVQRYEILCRKLVREQLYDAAALLLSPAKGGAQGEYSELSPATELRGLCAALAGHVARIAALDA